MESVRNDALHGEPALNHHHHFIPGLIHFPAVNTLDVEALEYDISPVNTGIVRHDAEHRDVASIDHFVQHIAERDRRTGHLEADIKTFEYSKALHEFSGDLLLADIDWFDFGHNPLGKVESVFVNVG